MPIHLVRKETRASVIGDMASNLRSLPWGDVFHRLSHVIAADHSLVTLPPSAAIGEALMLMSRQNFSQIPVVVGTHVLGVFSYRSFAQNISAIRPAEMKAIGQVPVEEFLDRSVAFAEVTDDRNRPISDAGWSRASRRSVRPPRAGHARVRNQGPGSSSSSRRLG